MNNLQEKVIRAMVDMYGFYSIEELSEMTEISISSIKRSLKDITKFIEDYDGKLLRVPKKGICMVVTDQQRENILEALDSYANGNPESFYYRKNYILDILFNYPANYTVQLFSEELCVSRKMIEKDLKMIEEYLATFHLELSKVQNQGISIVGREFDIRQAIVDTQNKKYWKHTYIEELPQELDYRISKRAFTYFSDYYSKEDIMMVQEYLADSEAELGVVLVDIATFLKKISIRHDYMLVEWDDLHKDVQQQIQSSYAVCLTYSFHLEEKLGFVLTQDEIAWLALLIHQASMETGSEKQGIFVMATDPYSAKYEAMKIENEISNLEIIKIVHIHDFKPELTKGKLVISTVPLKEKRNNVIEITKHVTQLDINKIISQMDEYAQEMKNEQVIETVKKAFQKELIVIDALATTKKETIAQVSKLLLEQGCLSEDVTEKVFELEERRPTTIGSQIAMAHVYKDSVKKSGIAVMRMKYPVKWSRSSKVKLVFFLAINMEESNEILKLFKYLYALIDNKEDIQKILEANSSGEIYELLMEEFH